MTRPGQPIRRQVVARPHRTKPGPRHLLPQDAGADVLDLNQQGVAAAAAVGVRSPLPPPRRPALVRHPLDEAVRPLLVPDQAEPGAGALERGVVAWVEEGLAAVEAVVPLDHRMEGAAARLLPEMRLAQVHDGLATPRKPGHGRGGRRG